MRALLRTLRVATLTLQGQRPQVGVAVHDQVVGRGLLRGEAGGPRESIVRTSDLQNRIP
jgi:hypothetical protein